MILCSILIPSLWRFNKLKQAIGSFYVTAPRDAFEVLVRLQENDPESIARKDELLRMGDNLRVWVGPPKPKGQGNSMLWNYLVPHASGKWHQYWSDDMMIDGDWSQQMAQLPLTGVIAQPEIHRLNNSRYLNDNAGPVPFVPATAWAEAGLKELPEPIDTKAWEIFCVQRQWRAVFLKGVSVIHNRVSDATLPNA